MPPPDHDAGRRHHAGGGISLQTLVIASIAATVTSYVVSRVWGPGTLISAAATPVIVALVSEFLRRPVETVSATAKRVPVVQRVPVIRPRPGTPVEDLEATGLPRPRQPVQPPPVDPGLIAAIEADEAGPAARRSGPRWGLVLATGAAAFAIVVGIYTVPDLVAGKSITGSGSATTFFGGSTSSKPKTKTKTVTEPAPTTVTTTVPATTTTVPQTTSTATAPTATATPPATPAPPTTTTPGATTSTSTTPTTPAPAPAPTAPPTAGTVPPVPGAP
ncbi:MAG: Fe-S oxidoreductase [Solirubrobacterales bacterium]|nr:Fe-S oxidoreductase [Solirubrobacterales bacterium]